MPRDLTALTGGTGGIGLATARLLLDQDPEARVALLDLRPDPAADFLAANRGRASFVECDVTDPGSVAAAFDQIDELDGTLNGLVNGAGNVDNSASVDLDFDVWRSVLAVHLDGAMLCSQQAGRRMLARGEGSIVNVASIAGLFGHPRRLPYSVAKAALMQLARTLAVEWARDGVRVNSVAPGFVETPMVERVQSLGLIDAEGAARLHAMKRMGRPEEIAEGIAFLLSDRAAFITGEVLRIDGGYSVLKVEVD
ncbi:MAG TPA: SDR family oxidoreductase [Solirubrobacterales bacterium]